MLWQNFACFRHNLLICSFASALLCFTTAASGQLVVALGDSDTSGYGVGPQQAFPAQLQAMLQHSGYHVRVVNAGEPGDTFGRMLARVDSDVPQGTRLVIVQGGYNDITSGVPPEVIISNIRSILARLRARGIGVVLCGYFDPRWDAIGRGLAASYGATFVSGSACYDPRYRGPDDLHMSAAGHQVVAGRLARVLERMLRRQ